MLSFLLTYNVFWVEKFSIFNGNFMLYVSYDKFLETVDEIGFFFHTNLTIELYVVVGSCIQISSTVQLNVCSIPERDFLQCKNRLKW